MSRLDFDEPPVITRRWWALGHLILVPPIRGPLRLRVHGADNIPSSGPVLIVSNHISQIDPPVLGVAVLPRRSHYMAKAELFRIPLLRRIFSDADKLALAMESRCYSEDRSDPALSARRGDWLVLAAGVSLWLLVVLT